MFRKRFHILLQANLIEVRNLGNGRLGRASGRFSHPRLLVGDFRAASQCLGEALREAGGAGLALHHCALIQPLERIEGGLSELEKELLLQLALANRMSEAVIHASSRPLGYQEALLQLQYRTPASIAGSWR